MSGDTTDRCVDQHSVNMSANIIIGQVLVVYQSNIGRMLINMLAGTQQTYIPLLLKIFLTPIKQYRGISTCHVYLSQGHNTMQAITITPGKIHQTKYGALSHADMIGRRFGTKV